MHGWPKTIVATYVTVSSIISWRINARGKIDYETVDNKSVAITGQYLLIWIKIKHC